MSGVILISGATSGIGRECALRLAARGNVVYGTGRSADENANTPFHQIRCDVTDFRSVEECVSRVLAEAGRIDVLINCAGFGLGGGIEDTTTEEVRDQFETNYFGAHRMIKAVMPFMRRQGGGKIICISSVASEFTIPFQSFYSASKTALNVMTQAVRMEGKPFNIIATCVNPGDARTGFTLARKQAAGCNPDSPYYTRALKSIDNMKRDEMQGMNPDRVADLVCRLVERNRLQPVYFVEGKYKGAMILKRILPVSWVEGILSKMYSQS